jgi:sporulation protein YlmC with PRC-barrel domain
MARPVHDAQPVVHRAVLRLLDHQVVGPDGELLGNIDDLELVVSDEGWSVTALLVGPAALGQRLPGRLGRWTIAIWRRLRTDPDPRPCRVPVEQVHDIGSAVTVTRAAADSLAASFGLELWLCEYVVSRNPGATGGGY